MSARNTRTGVVLENMVLPALTHGGYEFTAQVNIGNRIGGGKHFVDVIAKKLEEEFIISLKWQQTSGTAEQKVPFEVISLISAIEDTGKKFKKAYLVLGGDGWKLRDFYTGGGLDHYINQANTIRILKLEEFIALANSGSL